VRSDGSSSRPSPRLKVLVGQRLVVVIPTSAADPDRHVAAMQVVELRHAEKSMWPDLAQDPHDNHGHTVAAEHYTTAPTDPTSHTTASTARSGLGPACR
jgi:hypothetical protein